MFDFEDRSKKNSWWREESKRLPTGIDVTDMEVGMRVTISPNLNVYDRSYIDTLFEIVAFNVESVQLRSLNHYHAGNLYIFRFHEHHLYDANDFEIS